MKLNKVLSYSLPTFLSLSVLMLLYAPLEFRITEVWMIIPGVPIFLPILVLILSILIFNIFDWEKILSRNRILIFLFLPIFITSLFVYSNYREQKLSLEYLPKIYKIDREWGVQAQRVRIEGVNFFPAWKKGKVVLDKEEMFIRVWDEKLIIAEQQVPTKFGQMNLYVVREDGVVSNKVPFLIKNPKELSL